MAGTRGRKTEVSMMRQMIASAAIAALVLGSGAAMAQGRGGVGGGAPLGGGGGAPPRGAPAGGSPHGGPLSGHGGTWGGGGDGWRGDRWHGDGWRGSVGLYVGVPYWGWAWPYAYGYPYPYGYRYYAYPYYAYPYYSYPYYDPDPRYVPSEPRVYVERAPQTQSTAYWYYCTDPAGYYPYVETCSKPWMQVLPRDVPGASTAPAPSPPTSGGQK